MSNEQIDPELVDDRDIEEADIAEVELPDYDPEQFELSDDFEYTDELDGEPDASQNERLWAAGSSTSLGFEGRRE